MVTFIRRSNYSPTQRSEWWIQVSRALAAMLAPVPDITSNNETANTVVCVLAIGTSVLLLRPNRTTHNSRERTATQKAPKPTFAPGIAPWPTSPVSLNPLTRGPNYIALASAEYSTEHR